jgi:hypothetical protein
MFLAAPLYADSENKTSDVKKLAVGSAGSETSAPSLSSVYGTVNSSKGSVINSDSSRPFVFSFPSHRWNLIVDADTKGYQSEPLAGWQAKGPFESQDAFNMADTFNNFHFYGQSSKQCPEKQSETSRKHEESFVAKDGKSQYHFYDLKDDKNELFVANARHDVSAGRTLDARVLVSSERGGNSDFYVADTASPSRTTQLGIGANVGKIRVWGEFQMNDWNGLGGSVRSPQVSSGETNTEVSAAALSSYDSDEKMSSSSPFDNSLVSGRTAFEVGASFPASNVRGAVRYRRSFDEVDTSGGLSRQHLGFEGEVRIEDDVYFKAGYERVNSVSSASELNESNLWTGIEVNF